jgi:hypothetical protein
MLANRRPTGELLMTAPHARQPQVLARPACTPTAIRAVLAANAGGDILQRYDEDLDAASAAATSVMTPRCAYCISARTAEALVTFLVYPPDDLVLVVKVQWLGG